MMSRLASALRVILPWFLVATIGLFFAQTLRTNWDRLGGVSFAFDVWALLSIVAFTSAVVVSGVLWGSLLARLSGVSINKIDAIRIHAASWLLKYIPGQVGSFINKMLWGKAKGISKKTSSTGFIYENVMTVVAGIALSMPVVLLFGNHISDDIGLFVPLLIVLPLMVVFSGQLFRWLLNLLTKLAGKQSFKKSDFLPTSQLIVYQLSYLLPRVLNGVGFVFIAHSLLDVDPSMYVGLAAIYVLASIVGLLAIFVPGGLGVREAIVVLLASVYFPAEQAIILALVARLYATFADVGVAVVYLILNKGRLRQRI